MLTAKMLRGTRPIYHLVFLICLSIGYVYPFPLQVLPSIPGYIPVYIRYGDQPLEDINPAVAEAFHEQSSSSKNISLDNVSDSMDLNLEIDGENTYNVQAVRIRQVDNTFSDTDEKRKQATEKSIGTSELLAGDINRESRHETFKRETIQKPLIKVNPLTEEERKALGTLRIVTKKETQSTRNMYEGAHSSNDLQEEKGSSNEMQEKTQSSNSVRHSNLNPSKLSNDKPCHKDKKEVSNPTVKFSQIIVNESTQSDLHLIKDLSKLSTDEGAPPSPLINNESPTTEQRLLNILPNVRKLSPPPEILLQL
ncbi:uncharacterized protein LOC143372417 isoform X1 [Andrena cerasifolii]|uniref:uncharacterized protein LOC143372417 isoform X1 n=1 Tax=Andrena cerasifolii TaxID=2819439 RepID=UPI00403846EF